MPQRHRIMGFAAVVERGDGGKMPYRVCGEGSRVMQMPQRQRIAGFAAVVERRTDNSQEEPGQMIFVTFGA